MEELIENILNKTFDSLTSTIDALVEENAALKAKVEKIEKNKMGCNAMCPSNRGCTGVRRD